MSGESLSPEKALIFRIAHRDNVPWILEHGLHCRNATQRDPNYVNIGNTELIDRRAQRVVEIEPCGTLSDYVPFYFTPYSPMLYNIKTGYGGIPRRDNEEIVIFVSSLHRLRELGRPFVFTNRHAYLRATEYYNDPARLDQIDWPLLRSRNFRRDPDDPDKFARYEAEALVHQHLPLDGLLGLVCYNMPTKTLIDGQVGTQSLTRRESAARVVFLMLYYTQGNLLHAETEAVVNTVNTVGVMGKGIALAFKEAYPENFRDYEAACKIGGVQVGRMFVTENCSLHGPRWIINFPTKKHWRHPSRLEWVRDGLTDLRRVIQELGIRSIALPPLGCGQGGLDWNDVRSLIEQTLGDLAEVEVIAYEPTSKYHTPRKRSGSEKLTPARALVAEAVRRYSVLGIECSYLEVQKLAYFIERCVRDLGLKDPLRMAFKADRYGPYSDRLRHLLDGLDGAWMTSDKRLADSGPMDRISFQDSRRDELNAYLAGEPAVAYQPALERLSGIIDGFESPLGMELLATVDWLLTHEHTEASIPALRDALGHWSGGPTAAKRKQALFDDRLLGLALERLAA